MITRAAHNGDRQRAAVHAGVGPGGRTGTGTAGDVIGTSTQQRTTNLGAPSVRKALGTDRAIQLNLTLNGSAGVLNVAVLTRSAQAAHSPADLPHTGIPSSVWHVTLV